MRVLQRGHHAVADRLTWAARQDLDAAGDLIQQILALNEHIAVAGGDDTQEITGNLLDLRMWALTFMNSLGDKAATAVAIGEPLLADAEQLLGWEHFKTLNTGNDLATAYRAAGRADQAIAMQERIVDASGKVLGSEHPHALG